MTEKRSTYNASAQKRYKERHNKTTIACQVTQSQKKAIKQHATRQGYTSVNAYLLHILEADGVDFGRNRLC